MTGLVTQLFKRLQIPLFAALEGGLGVAPTNVNAGIDASFDLLSAAPYQLSGSATGATSYAWTKVSGTPVPTFSNVATANPTVTFDVDGAVTLRLTATNASGSATDDVIITVTATLAALITRLGARLQYLREVGVSAETLNGSNFSQLNDLGPNGFHLTQGTAGNQPSKVTAGGPAGKNCCTFQDVTRNLSNTTIALSTGRALTFFAVLKAAATTIGITCHARPTDASNSANSAADWGNFDATHYLAAATPDGGVVEVMTVTSPALDTNWHVWSQRYAASVAPVIKCDNAAVAPGYLVASGKSTLVESTWWGTPVAVSLARGSVYMDACIEDLGATAGTACLSEEGAVRYYINKQTGL